MRRIPIAVFLLLIPLCGHAGIYKCETEAGIAYSYQPCDNAQKMDMPEYETPRTPGLRQGERRMLNDINRKNQTRKNAAARSAGKTLTYSDKLRLRELQMRRTDLGGQLKKDHLSVGSGIAVKEEIRSIDREIQQIYSRRR